jgi:hypothetical protein
VPLDALRGRTPAEVFIPLDRALDHLPAVSLRPEGVEKIRNGRPVGPDDLAAPAPGGLTGDAPCRLVADGRLIATGFVVADPVPASVNRWYRPRKVFL